MTYEALVRHTRSVPTGDGIANRLERLRVEATSEEEAFGKVHQTSDDHIVCIDSWHHEGVMAFSVETGDPEFFSEAHRPTLPVTDLEVRCG